MEIGIGTRVNHSWCGDGTVTGIDGNYFQIEWDSGLSNENIKGYHRNILSVLDK
jgi:hypothetical protein